MLRLSEEYGAPTVLRALLFLGLRLQKFEQAASIAQEIEQWRLELAEAEKLFEQRYTERLAATAEVSYRDDVLDHAVLNLAQEASRLLPGGETHPSYERLFPVAPAEAVASTASERQHRFVRGLIAALLGDPALGALRSHAALLEQRQAGLEEALAEREECFQRETAATRRRNEALDEACRAYNRSFSRLQLLLRDGPRIESMYPSLPGSRAPEPLT